MVKVVSFNDKEIPSFVKVTGITFPVLPELDVKEANAPRRYGNIDTGVEFKGKPYSLSVVITIPEGRNLHDIADELKVWLRGDNWKPSKLVFAEQPDKYVLARAASSLDIDDLFLYGEGEIEFYSADSLKYDSKEKTVSSVKNVATVAYAGLEKAPSVITVSIAANCTNLKIKHTPSNFVITLKGNFKKGQTVTIDSVRKLVKVDKVTAMTLLDFRSRWLLLESGENVFTLTTDTAGVDNTFKVGYRTAY